jgi:hypothetical protein
MQVEAKPFLMMGVDICEMVASKPCSFTSGETASIIHCICNWVQCRTSTDLVKIKSLYSYLESNLHSSAVSPVA